MKWARLFATILAAIAFAAVLCPASAQSLQPEDAYLSPQRYLNRYFGLSLAIPKELKLVPIPVSEAQGVKRWLLALQSGTGAHKVTVTITADPPPKNGNVASALRSEFAEFYPGPGKPVRLELGGETLWKIAVPENPQTDTSNIVEYAGIVRDYLLTIRVATEVGPMPDGFDAFVERAQFVPPSEIAAQRNADMFDYAGPALPERLGDPTPAIARLPLGTTLGGEYRNDLLGFNYHIPEGLQSYFGPDVNEELASNHLQAWGGGTDGKTAEAIARTCTRTLLFAGDRQQRDDGHVGPSVIITAIDPVCLQGAHFPASPSDTEAVRPLIQVLAQRVRLGRPGSTMTAKAYRIDNHFFVNLSGVFYGTERATGLKIPNRLRMVATQLNGYVVVWTFIAPDEASLERLANNPVRFYRAEMNQGAAGTTSSAENSNR